MYAALIGAGVSQLYDLFRSQTSSASDSTNAGQSASTPTSATQASSSAATSIGTGSSLSTDVQSLLTDLQAGGSSGSADATNTVAGDLQNVFKDLKVGGHHGHHGGRPPESPPSDGSTDATSGGTGTSSSQNPFTSLASSLLAYQRTQASTQSASTVSLSA